LVAVAFLHFREAPADAPELRLEVNAPRTTEPFSFALSPDGRSLAFVASAEGRERLYLRRLDDVTARPLAGTEGGVFPFWSPDSRSIGFFASGKLKRTEATGGEPQVLATAPFARGGAWNRDGTILFAPSGLSPLYQVPGSGGNSIPLTRLDSPRQSAHKFPQF